MRFTTGSHRSLAGLSAKPLQRTGELGQRNHRPEDRWVEAPEKPEFADKIITSLFPPSEYVGQVKCLGKVSVDGRDYDGTNMTSIETASSARTFYSHRSMLVEKASGIPFRTVSVSRRHAHQWMETRRYDPALAIQVPPPPPDSTRWPALTSKPPDGHWPPSGWNSPPFVSMPPADAPWPPPVQIWPPPSPYWPPPGRY